MEVLITDNLACAHDVSTPLLLYTLELVMSITCQSSFLLILQKVKKPCLETKEQ